LGHPNLYKDGQDLHPARNDDVYLLWRKVDYNIVLSPMLGS